MNIKSRVTVILLGVTLALAGCGVGNGSDSETSASEKQTAHVIGVRPAETCDIRLPDEQTGHPLESGDSADPFAPFQPLPGTAILLSGTVVEYPGEELMANVLAVRVSHVTEGQVFTSVMLIHHARAHEFCEGDIVFFTYEPEAEPVAYYNGVAVYGALTIMAQFDMIAGKPVIYLYPETPTEVSVELTLDGELTCTYPAYDEGWNNFTAYPDGTLIAPDGKEYYCLYWEGKQNTVYDFSRGFCVKGEDTAAFLEWALAAQGLTPREANEFIIYWLPRMEQNPYNVISFQTTAYTDTAVLEVAPAPDTLIRVFMAWYPTEKAVNIPAQSFEPVERSGFTVVEWGGSERNHCG